MYVALPALVNMLLSVSGHHHLRCPLRGSPPPSPPTQTLHLAESSRASPWPQALCSPSRSAPVTPFRLASSVGSHVRRWQRTAIVPRAMTRQFCPRDPASPHSDSPTCKCFWAVENPSHPLLCYLLTYPGDGGHCSGWCRLGTRDFCSAVVVPYTCGKNEEWVIPSVHIHPLLYVSAIHNT